MRNAIKVFPQFIFRARHGRKIVENIRLLKFRVISCLSRRSFGAKGDISRAKGISLRAPWPELGRGGQAKSRRTRREWWNIENNTAVLKSKQPSLRSRSYGGLRHTNSTLARLRREYGKADFFYFSRPFAKLTQGAKARRGKERIHHGDTEARSRGCVNLLQIAVYMKWCRVVIKYNMRQIYTTMVFGGRGGKKMLVEVHPTGEGTHSMKTSPSLSKKQVVLSNLTPNVRGQIW